MFRRFRQGFTLIELVVVILIIGIVAAIVAPVFLNDKQELQDSKATNTVTTAQAAMEQYRAITGSYAGATEKKLIILQPTLAEAHALLMLAVVGTDHYELSVTSKGDTPTHFFIERANSKIVRTCDQAAVGRCSKKGTW
jgi:prepilin-type N-terminal cleavage/methylation domain-containing protein